MQSGRECVERTNETKEDFEHLRLLKAFLKIKDPALRQAIIELVERTAPLASEKNVSDPREYSQERPYPAPPKLP